MPLKKINFHRFKYLTLKKENEAAALYGVTIIPEYVLTCPTGKVIAKDIKGKKLRDKLADLVASK